MRNDAEPKLSGIQMIPVDQIEPTAKAWREPAASIDKLVESLSHAPLLHAIVVRPNRGGAKPFKIVAGNVRLAALIERGERDAPCRVTEAIDDETAERYGLEEDLQRLEVAHRNAALKRLYELNAHLPVRPGRPRKSRHGGGSSSGPSRLAATARQAGISKRTAQRILRIGNPIPPVAAEAKGAGKEEPPQVVEPKALPVLPAEPTPSPRYLIDSVRDAALRARDTFEADRFATLTMWREVARVAADVVADLEKEDAA
jgi:hypothetical protein